MKRFLFATLCFLVILAPFVCWFMNWETTMLTIVICLIALVAAPYVMGAFVYYVVLGSGQW